MSAKLRQFLSDTSGAAFVEMSLGISLLLLVVLGIIEFSYVFYQYNAADKAMQWAARVAAVSNPVASDLANYTGLDSTHLPGDALPANAYDVTCQASDALGNSVSCTGTFTTADATAFKALIYGRLPGGGATTCNTSTAAQTGEYPGARIGICNYLRGIQASNIVVRYQYTGLGYAGRPGGAVPSVTVSLRNMQYQYIFLGGFIGASTFNMPSFATTVTGEDLNSAGS
ncbi:MAG: pilus assembly protein [Alphaproteobacteria bacterium]|nr:pilus assembly protein [Alphaproteobacteria bacterium]